MLGGECALRASHFFQNIPNDLRECAVVKYPWTKTEYTPRITGIPPHILIMAEMEELKKQVSTINSKFKEDLNTCFDERLSADSADFRTNQIINAINESQQSMIQMMQTFSPTMNAGGSDEIADVTENNGTEFELVDEGVELGELFNGDELAGDVTTTNDDNIVSDVGGNNSVAMLRRRRRIELGKQAYKKRKSLKIGYYNGQLQVLPIHWVLPKMTIKQLVYNWKIGNTSEKVPPLGTLQKWHVNHIPNAWAQLRKMNCVMCVIERLARAKNTWIDSTSWSLMQVNLMYDSIKDGLKEYFSNVQRKVEVSWKTVYNKMVKLGAFPNGRGVGNGRGRNNMRGRSRDVGGSQQQQQITMRITYNPERGGEE